MEDDGRTTSSGEHMLSRRDVLVRGGQLAAGLAGAGALAGTARATTRRILKNVPAGGNITWAINQDPTALAPWGVLLESSHWGSEFMYDSLLGWDLHTNVVPALAESYVVKDPRTVDFTLRKGVMFHNGQEMTSADVVYSIQQQMNPPAPGSTGVLSFFPAIVGVSPVSKYVVRVKLSKPDASLFGWFAWSRWSSIAPNGMYSQINPVTQGIGTGPFKLVEYVPNDHIAYTKWGQFWKPGLPYLDGLTLKIIPDEQTAIAALQAGALDGATISPANAMALNGNSAVTVLKGLTAGFYELQFTVKAGDNKPWADKRVRQAINMAINRPDMTQKVFAGQAQYTGHVPPGYGQWPLPQSALQQTWQKYDLKGAQSLMKQAGFSSGFPATLQVVGTVAIFQQIAQLLQSYVKQIGIDLTLQSEDGATFSKNYAAGTFDWLLNQRGIRGDVHGFVSEFNPGTSPNYDLWFSGYKNIEMWRLVGNGQITLDPKKRLPMYTKLQQILLTELLEIPLVDAYKYQVVSKRLKNMYVAYSDFNTGLRTAYIET
jgi:peptide/nickel transport system substrate-binding protein